MSAGQPGATILVVDDDPAFLRYAERVLSGRGHACRLAVDLQSASTWLRSERFDLVVTDIHLPDGDGLELLRLVAELPGRVPVVVVTGLPSVATAVRALRLEAVDYVEKPAVDLDACVERALERARRQSGPSAAARDPRAWADQLRAIADYLSMGDPATTSEEREAPTIESSAQASPLWAVLSPRERRIVELLLDGVSPAEAASALTLSVSTVRNHIQSAYRKLGVRSQLELVARLRPIKDA